MLLKWKQDSETVQSIKGNTHTTNEKVNIIINLQSSILVEKCCYFKI